MVVSGCRRITTRDYLAWSVENQTLFLAGSCRASRAATQHTESGKRFLTPFSTRSWRQSTGGERLALRACGCLLLAGNRFGSSVSNNLNLNTTAKSFGDAV